MKKNLFFVDAETDGLYGDFLSIAVIVTDMEYTEKERHYWGIAKENLKVKDQWVLENVVPVMGEYEACKEETELLERFWEIWEKYSDGAYAVADVCYPVEMRLFEKCIMRDLNKRMYQAPYPLLDLSSFLWTKGIDPLTERKELIKGFEGQQHHALTDVKMMIQIMRGKAIFSYHTFLFPFILEECQTEEKRKEVQQIFSKNQFWEKVDFEKMTGSGLKEQWRSYFAQYQYFHPAVRDALFGSEKQIVENYRIKLECLSGASYEIKKEDKKYALEISNIFLKIFNTGVAVLGIECENWDHRTMEDVLKINDYGRKIFLPFIPKDIEKSICADELQISLYEPKTKQKVQISESFEKRINKLNEKKQENQEKQEKNLWEAELSHISACITGLLGLGSEFEFTAGNKKGEKTIRIYPGLDERMYVMCLVQDEETIACLTSDIWKEDGDDKERNLLYRYAFVDAGECSCQSVRMRDALLQEHTYDRWLNYKTRFCVTPQAFQCITNFDANINTFRTSYMQMAILALVQRTTLIDFQNQALALSRGMENAGKALTLEKISDLMDLQERFVAFQNQINFIEVSSQEQAIELYKMLRKAEFIDELNEVISGQLSALYDATNTNQDFSFNKWALIIALLAIGLSEPSALLGAVNELFLKCGAKEMVWMDFVPLLLAVLIGLWVWRRFQRKRGNKKRWNL